MASAPGVNGTAKITLYWLEKSRSQRILWLLEELELEYELKTFRRGVDLLAPAELQAVHPLGKSPVLTVAPHAEAPVVTIAESANIIEYLIEHFGPQLKPRQWKDDQPAVGGETEAWLRYRYFMHYGEGTLMPLLVTAVLLQSMKARSPIFVRPMTSILTGAVEAAYLKPNLKRNFDFLEKELADQRQYLCGSQLTGADFLLQFPLSSARGRTGLSVESHPHLCQYVERLEGRDAFKRAVAKIVEVEGSYDAKL